MKKGLKLFAVILAACFLISGTSVSAFAASNYSVSVPITQNYADAQKVLNSINKQRAKRGLRKLKLDQSLTKSAILRATELAIYVPESSPHIRPNGKKASTVNKKIIYECCAEGYETPKDVMAGWMSSPPHKKGILLKNAKSVGIGCVTTKNGTHYWTLEFGGSKAAKVVKSKKKTSAAKKVSVKPANFKKRDCYLSLAGIGDDWFGFGNELEVGGAAYVRPFFSNNFGFENQLRASDYTWKTSNKNIVAITKTGKIRGKKAGKATITATMKKAPKYTLRIKVTVTEPYDYFDDY